MLDTVVVGAGAVADWHHGALAACDRARTVAVVDVDADRAAATAAEWGVDAYTDLGDALADRSVDWVHVCTPVGTHRELAVRSLSAGVPVLVEKPFTRTREGYEAVVAAAKEAGRRATVVHNQAYYPMFVRARDLVASGAYGEVRGLSVTWTEGLDPREPDRGDWVLDLPGGEFGEGVVHPVYCAIRAAGPPADADSLSVRRLDRTSGDAVGFDGLAVDWRTPDDVAVQVQHHARSAGARRIDYALSGGRVTVDFPTFAVHRDPQGYDPHGDLRYPRTTGTLRRFGDALRSARSTLDGLARSLAARLRGETYEAHDTHTPVVAREAEAIETGSEGPTPPAEADWANRVFTRL